MHIRTIALPLLLALSVSGTDVFAQGRDGSASPQIIDLGDSGPEAAAPGNWIWGILTDPPLSGGVTVVASDAAEKSTFYAGGLGYVAVSRDSGANWSETLTFSHAQRESSESGDAEQDISTLDVTRLAAVRREFIRQEIIDKYQSDTYADSILDSITDSDLVEAHDLSDIEELEILELDMDPDLSHIPMESDEGIGDTSFLSDFETYPERYVSLVRRGAEPSVALNAAADSLAVWQILSRPEATYVVTSDAVFRSSDHGTTWDSLLTADFGESFLSVAVSPDGRMILVGTSDGIMQSTDGGELWQSAGPGVGGIFQIHFVDGGRILAVSPGRIYESSDKGEQWREMQTPVFDEDFFLDLEPGKDGRMLVLTTYDLYRVYGREWESVPNRPFGDENMRQIVAADGGFSKYIVRTDARVYEFNHGWIDQNQALFATGLTHFSYIDDGVSLGILGSQSGLWVAQDISVVEKMPEYKAIKEKWAREPSDEEVISQALETHYLGSTLDQRWGLRSIFAWFLPRIDFDYIFRQERWDYHKVVTNVATGIDDSNVWTSKRQTQHDWQIMAHWDFQIERAHADSIAREATLAGLRDDRYALIKKVITELNKRHALDMTLTLELPKLPDNARASKVKSMTRKQIKAKLGLAEAEAHLNYLTGGAYLPAIRSAENRENHP